MKGSIVFVEFVEYSDMIKISPTLCLELLHDLNYT